MAAEPDNLVLAILREIRVDMRDLREQMSRIGETLREVRLGVAGHDLRFDAMDENFDMIREGAVSAIGYAANANRAHIDLHKQIAEPSRRVEKLEASR